MPALRTDRPEAAAMFAVLLAATVVAVVLRMEMPWSAGGQAAVAVPAAMLAIVLAAMLGGDPRHAPATAILVAIAVLLVPLAMLLGLDAAGVDSPLGDGLALTATLLLTVLVAAVLGWRTRSSAAWFLTAVTGVGLLLAAANGIFDASALSTFRALLALSAAGLIGAAVMREDRRGTLLGVVGGFALIALGSLGGGFAGLLLFFGYGGAAPWFWGAVQLAGGLVLLLLALRRAEPGLGYVGGLTVLQVGLLAIARDQYAGEFSGAVDPSSDITLVGWPLALIVVTAVAGLLVIVAPRAKSPDDATPPADPPAQSSASQT